LVDVRLDSALPGTTRHTSIAPQLFAELQFCFCFWPDCVFSRTLFNRKTRYGRKALTICKTFLRAPTQFEVNHLGRNLGLGNWPGQNHGLGLYPGQNPAKASKIGGLVYFWLLTPCSTLLALAKHARIMNLLRSCHLALFPQVRIAHLTG
jgi:hypothetical protein